MSAFAYAVTDSATMLRRNLRRLVRYPSMTLMLVGMPIVFLLLFVYVFGGQLGAGLGHGLNGGHAGRAGYLDYVTPGILLMTVAAAVQGTAIVVAMDMTAGIIDRFRTMAIARACVLTGHVLASLIQTLFSLAVVLGVAVALGFRPTAGAGNWLAALGVLMLFAFALIWLATALGLAAKSVETASNTPIILTLLPRQRLRAHGDHADRAAAVRDISAVHARHRDPPRTAHRHANRCERHQRHRLEHWHRCRLLPLGQTSLSPPQSPLIDLAWALSAAGGRSAESRLPTQRGPTASPRRQTGRLTGSGASSASRRSWASRCRHW
jgi:ABC-2 type transport system permease protein